jgi:hypothetical protein
VLCPAQIVTLEETETTGGRLTLTVICAEELHPFRSPTTVYVVVEAGLAVTLAAVDEFNDDDGLHK